jgi:hypothetical protein
VINPGFYDSDIFDDSVNGSEATPNGSEAAPAQGYADAAPNAGYDAGSEPMPEPAYAQAPPADARMPRPAYAGSSTSAPAPEPAITVIFKDGRAAENIQNYMMNSRTLTNLDGQRYEQIPLNEIDLAATEQANHARGVSFEIPSGALR